MNSKLKGSNALSANRHIQFVKKCSHQSGEQSSRKTSRQSDDQRSHHSGYQSSCKTSYQSGFTLLELMIAMAIFAMLAVAGWQVFDSISRSKERAELQTDVLTELQYGYQQIQRDMAQVVAYQLPNSNGSRSNTNSLSSSGLDNGSNDSTTSNLANGFSLQSNQLSFIRYADPDPRYLQSNSLERIVYTFNDGNLIRQRYTTLNSSSNERPLTSVIVKGANAGQWQVLLPEPASIYPDTNAITNQLNRSTVATDQNAAINESVDSNKGATLPRGVKVTFNITLGNVEAPISWVYALSKIPPAPKPLKKTPQTSDTNSKPDSESKPETNPEI